MDRIAGYRVEIPQNPALAAELERLRAAGSASDAELAALEKLAGRLSWTEATAIRETVNGLDRVSEGARRRLDDYMWNELEARAKHVERYKKIGDAVNVGALATTVVAVPVLNHVLAVTGLDVGLNAAANAVQIALLAGEYLGGIAAARLIGDRIARRGSDYGDED